MAPKSILKKPNASSSARKAPLAGNKRAEASTAGPSKPRGEGNGKPSGSKKPKQSISIAQKSGKGKGPAGKVVKKVVREDDDDDEDGDEDEDMEDDDDEDEVGTDEEIQRAQGKGGKVKPAVKRKRPTTADEFGSALTSLLSESTKPKDKKAITASTPLSALPTAPEPKAKKAKTTVQPILSLSRAKLPPTATTEKLERQAARAVKREKEEKEDRARVRDVVEGWSHAGPGEGEVIGGLEFEKGLRKTAQRGVIKLFNAILTASRNDETLAADDPASVIAKSAAAAGVKGYGKKDKGNIMGRGGKEELTKEGFLELVKKGAGR